MSNVKRRVALLLSMTTLLSGLGGCNLSGGLSNSIVSEDDALGIADDFIGAVLEINGKKALKIVVEDDQDSEYFEQEDLIQDKYLGEAVLKETKYEMDEDSVKFKNNNKECKVSYEITMPEYKEVYSKCYEENMDIDEAIYEAEKDTFEITVKLNYENEEWLVKDFEDVCDEFYGDRLYVEAAVIPVKETEVKETEPAEEPASTTVIETEAKETEESEPVETESSSDSKVVPTVVPSTAEIEEYKNDYTMDDVMNAKWNDGIFSFDGNVISMPYPYAMLADKWDLPEKYDSPYYLNPGKSVLEMLKSGEIEVNLIDVSLVNNYDAPIEIRDASIERFHYSRVSDEDGHYFEFILPGGIKYGDSMDDVYNIYGEPEDAGEYAELKYMVYEDGNGNSLWLYFKDDVNLYGFDYTIA